MKKQIIKKLCFILVWCLITSGLAACNSKQTANKTISLSYWVDLNPSAVMTVSQYGETPFAKELQKRTGVEIKYIHPPQGQGTEKFNIMMASNNLPDIIEYSWTNYPGGPEKAIKDGYLLKLDDNMGKSAPNYSSFLRSHPEIDKMVKTDSGHYFGFPFIRGDKSLQVSAGLVVRQDWLKDLGMEIPTTISEWENMLMDFKTKKNATAPLTLTPAAFSWGCFAGAFNTTRSFYVRDNKVVYGPAESQYKSFLELMNKWYKAKLLDNNLATTDSKLVDTNILNGFSGATASSIGSGIGRWMSAKTDPKFEVAAAPYPTLNKGEKPQFGQIQLQVPYTYAAVSTSCKNIEAAMKLLDYGYGEAGHMLFNFGIEGESYKMTEGYPKYTDYITNNPQKLSMTAAMARYLQAYSGGPFIQDIRFMEQYAVLPSQREAWKVWSNTDADKYLLPQLYVAQDEAKEIASLTNAINTYESEQCIKFIMGVESLSNFDKYVQELKNRGLDKVLAIYQSAYERCMKR